MSKLKKLMAVLCASVLVLATGCREKSGDSSKKPETTSAVTTTTAVTTENTQTTTQGTTAQKPEIINPLEERPESDITPLLWKITTDSGKNVYFMGSIHALPDEAFSIPHEIMDAYNSSDALAVECDIVEFESDMSLQMKTSMMMFYTDGTNIKDHIKPEIIDKLIKLAKDHDLYNDLYLSMKPSFWYSLASQCMMEDSDLNGENGFDTYLLRRAKADGKEIIEVESIMAQYKMLNSFSDETYNILLDVDYDTTAEENNEMFRELYDTWAGGNYEEYKASVAGDEAEDIPEEYKQKMYYERNKVMADKLVELSKGDKNVFYVVGYAHYSSQNSILDFLDEAGVKYEQVKYD